MAIGYKQIALYYSLVFFIWLLMKCWNNRVCLLLLSAWLVELPSVDTNRNDGHFLLPPPFPSILHYSSSYPFMEGISSSSDYSHVSLESMVIWGQSSIVLVHFEQRDQTEQIVLIWIDEIDLPDFNSSCLSPHSFPSYSKTNNPRRTVCLLPLLAFLLSLLLSW